MSQNPQPSVVGVEAEKESKENNAIDSKEVQSGRRRPKIIIDEFTASAIRRVQYIRSIAYEDIPLWIRFLPVARRMGKICQSSAALHFGDC